MPFPASDASRWKQFLKQGINIHRSSLLLPRCYQDGTNQPHLLSPLGQYPELWFLVGLGFLWSDRQRFVKRRSVREPPDHFKEMRLAEFDF